MFINAPSLRYGPAYLPASPSLQYLVSFYNISIAKFIAGVDTAITNASHEEGSRTEPGDGSSSLLSPDPASSTFGQTEA